MLTDTNYLPITSIDDLALTSKLVEKERRFQKPLRFNNSKSKTLANVILNDTPDNATAIYLCNTEDTDRHKQITAAIKDSEFASLICDENIDQFVMTLPIATSK
jgi:Protein of unknown function (DUF1173)